MHLATLYIGIAWSYSIKFDWSKLLPNANISMYFLL